MAITDSMRADTFPKREYGLDWLRIIAFAILIFYHTGLSFVPGGLWYVKNPETSESLTHVLAFFNRWRLPLLFFISGGAVYFSLRSRTYLQFAGERLRRLLIPLLFGTFVIVPPQIYWSRLSSGVHYASYLEFWKTVFECVPYDRGNLTWAHLWFVGYVLVYSLLLIPIFALLKSAVGRRLIEQLAAYAEKPGVMYLISVPTILASYLLSEQWPVKYTLYGDWGNVTVSVIMFLWGFIICSNERFLDAISEKRRELIIFSLIMTAIFFSVRLSSVMNTWTEQTRYVATVLLDCSFGFGWQFTALAFSRVYLNKDSALLRYASKAVYPFFIVHQSISITLVYFLAPCHTSIAIKLSLVALGTFLGSWLIYDVVRRTRTTRLLFGIK